MGSCQVAVKKRVSDKGDFFLPIYGMYLLDFRHICAPPERLELSTY